MNDIDKLGAIVMKRYGIVLESASTCGGGIQQDPRQHPLLHRQPKQDASMTTWDDKIRETFERNGSALILRVGIEAAVKIKNLSYECWKSSPNCFNERMWQEGLAQIFGYHLPPLQPGETYQLTIV